jgi:MFS family permease
VPRHERLAQADLIDELRDTGVAMREALHDSEAIHVGKRLVDQAQRAQLIGWIDDGGDGGPDVGGRGGQGSFSEATDQSGFISIWVDRGHVSSLSCPYTRPMERRSALALLGVLGAGVFLAGLELMVTAVALPSIVVDLADWSALRTASWIVNGYLLAAIVTMPLAGRLADRWGPRQPFLAALAIFALGSALAGRAQSLDELIAARIVQAIGGGILVPVATAAAAGLFEGQGRPRALGAIGALTFLGMAAGPFVGAWIIESAHPAAFLDASGINGSLRDALDAPWRYVFYLNVPIAIAALALAWAAPPRWDSNSRPALPRRLDLLGAVAFSSGLAALLVGVTLAGSDRIAELSVDPGFVLGAFALAAIVGIALAVKVGLRRPDPFIDPRWFRSQAFSSAALVSLLTGYGFATAIIGGAVFVDRVLYGGPDVQRFALGALAAATALGAFISGFVLRRLGLRLTTAAGLILAVGALVRMAAWTPATGVADVSASLAAFGFGFGLTVTPRSTAAVEALGRSAFGIASATVTVARMIGMAVGLAILSAFGSTVIDRLFAAVHATPEAYKAFIPVGLRDRQLHDGLVVQALESWASGEAARILVGVFLVAAAVMAIALVPALALERGILARPAVGGPGQTEGEDDAGAAFAL